MTLLDLFNFLTLYPRTQVSFLVDKGMVFINALTIDPETKRNVTHSFAASLFEMNNLTDKTQIMNMIKDITIRLEKKLGN